MNTINEIGQERVDSIAMRKNYLLKELKRLNFPATYSFVCDSCWSVTRVQKRTLTKKRMFMLLKWVAIVKCQL